MRSGEVIRYEGKRGTVWRLPYRDASGRRVRETLGRDILRCGPPQALHALRLPDARSAITSAAAAGNAPLAATKRAGLSDLRTTQGYIDLAAVTLRGRRSASAPAFPGLGHKPG